MRNNDPDYESEGFGFYDHKEVVPDPVQTFDHYRSPSPRYRPSIVTKRGTSTQYSNVYETVPSSTRPLIDAYSSPHSEGTETSTVVHANNGGSSTDSYHLPWHESRHPTPCWHKYHHAPLTEHHNDNHTNGPHFSAEDYHAPWQEYHSAPETLTQYQGDHHINDPTFLANAFDAPHHDYHPIRDDVTEYRDDQPFYNEEGPFSQVPSVEEYNERDILCGRGALMLWHPGNQFFRRLIQSHRQHYFFARRQEKKNIASEIINEIRDHGGRFLRRALPSDGTNNVNAWVEIDDERAYQKTCQALREGAPEIRRQYRNKSSRDSGEKEEVDKEHEDFAASK